MLYFSKPNRREIISRKNNSILVIPDLHCPYEHVDALPFLKEVKKKYKTTRTILLGDEIDGAAISFHEKDPDMLFSPSSELEAAIEHLQPFYKELKHAEIIESNHGSLYYRRGKHAGIPRHVLKSYNDILEAPKTWKWSFDLTIKLPNKQSVYFHHGLSTDCMKVSQNKAMCYAQGHYHGKFELRYWANSLNLYWGATVGCLIDHKSRAFAYGKNTLPKPILGCLVIKDSIPHLIPMALDAKGRWTGKLP